MTVASARPPQARLPPGRAQIRILLVDDHEMVRVGVRSIVNQASGLVVVGECTDGAEVLQTAAAVQPDMVLMDLQMPVMGGVDATRILLASRPDIKVLVLTGWANGRALMDVEQAGAAGCVFKGGDPAALIDAIRVIATGGTVWPSHSRAMRR